MRKLFSSAWKSNKSARKQHKYQANAPLHTKHKFLSAHLSKELRKKYGKRALPLKKGDEVLIMRGAFAKKKAKVVSVNLKKSSIILENINRTKKDGSKIVVKFHPSVLQIVLVSDESSRKSPVKNAKSEETKTEKTHKSEVKTESKPKEK
jgi:large subunit ribosomal protein L24